jgi:hypothetical protein
VVGWWRLQLQVLAAPRDKPILARGLARGAVKSSGRPCLALELPASSILMVDSVSAIERMIADLRLSPSGTIGLDAEWTPSGFLLQLAVSNAVYLVDLHTLVARGDEASVRALDAALSALFGDLRRTKLAFGLRDEFRTLSAAYPRMRAFQAETLHGCVCVQQLHARAPRKGAPRSAKSSAALDAESDDSKNGGRASLSAVCDELLGGPLDKTSQMSDWERRPLTEAQRRYAALDAHCLLALFDLLQGPR